MRTKLPYGKEFVPCERCKRCDRALRRENTSKMCSNCRQNDPEYIKKRLKQQKLAREKKKRKDKEELDGKKRNK